jgi:DNA-binding response OmpR family regulator
MSQPIRILNVDDNEAQRYATSRVLTAAGFEVVEADTGKQALALAGGVDLIVLDVDLPDIDGFALTRTLKTEATTAQVPIIQVSAVFSTYSHVRDGLRNGADAYFTFPLDTTSLISTIKELTQGRSPA